jgi:hypothetical protein
LENMLFWCISDDVVLGFTMRCDNE